MRETSRSEGSIPFARRVPKQTARKAPSLWAVQRSRVGLVQRFQFCHGLRSLMLLDPCRERMGRSTCSFCKDHKMNPTSQAETREPLSPVAVRSSLVIRPLDPVMGAEVVGLDATRPLLPDTKRRLEDAFNEYKLLCFRDQILTTDSLVAFTRNWGVPGEHTMPGQLRGDITDVNIASNADANGKPNGIHPDPTAMRWHTDRSWRPDPVTATLLYGVEVPRRRRRHAVLQHGEGVRRAARRGEASHRSDESDPFGRVFAIDRRRTRRRPTTS